MTQSTRTLLRLTGTSAMALGLSGCSLIFGSPCDQAVKAMNSCMEEYYEDDTYSTEADAYCETAEDCMDDYFSCVADAYADADCSTSTGVSSATVEAASCVAKIDYAECEDAEEGDHDDDNHDMDGDSFTIDWGDSSVSLTITGGADWYYWGIAETSGVDAWTGEDCSYGYAAGDTTYIYCHLAAGDDTTSLEYGGPYDALSEGEETVFPQAGNYSDTTTHLIYDANDPTQCWVTGDDPSYYSDWNCDSF